MSVVDSVLVLALAALGGGVALGWLLKALAHGIALVKKFVQTCRVVVHHASKLQRRVADMPTPDDPRDQEAGAFATASVAIRALPIEAQRRVVSHLVENFNERDLMARAAHLARN